MAEQSPTSTAQTTKEPASEVDNSLGKQAFERAMSGATPRTMTAFEWEQWQALQAEEAAGNSGNE